MKIRTMTAATAARINVTMMLPMVMVLTFIPASAGRYRPECRSQATGP
jgi:signal transduction protein with GAF and PtsI domain